MKRKFDIKFRPQIESGEYKVQTRDGRKARIICWDRKANDHQIVVLVTVNKEEEIMCLFNLDGKILEHYESDSDLFVVTPEQELTEFEEGLVNFYNERSRLLPDKDGVYNKHDCAELLHKSAKILLELAKKELCKDCPANLEGYIKGREEASKEKEMEYKHEGPTIPSFWPPCYHGGECTNPFRDCINCPRQSIIGINTTTGTSTSKVEGKK